MVGLELPETGLFEKVGFLLHRQKLNFNGEIKTLKSESHTRIIKQQKQTTLEMLQHIGAYYLVRKP